MTGTREIWNEDWLFVTTPIQPDLDEVVPMLEEMLERNWLTNHGPFARQLEETLARRMGVDDVVLTSSGTASIELALKSLAPPGEVITTGYSFPATWALLVEDQRWDPVFVDIDDTFCLDPDRVEAAITPRSTAIYGMHAYGYPCDHARLQAIADKHGLPLLYDAAPCFGVEVDGRGIGALGDLSAFSFHATKVYNTLEGGALTGTAPALEETKLRRSFGLGPGGDPIRIGQNAKMDEMRAIFGLANLAHVDRAISRRGEIEAWYLDRLPPLGIEELDLVVARLQRPGVVSNHGYFPVMVKPSARMDRDRLFDHLRSRGILPRKYFSGTVPTTPLFKDLYEPGSLPRTVEASEQALCLPLHARMTEAHCERVVRAIAEAYCARVRYPVLHRSAA